MIVACGRCLIQDCMSPLSDDGSETLPPDALRRLVVGLSQRLGALEAQVAELQDELASAEVGHLVLERLKPSQQITDEPTQTLSAQRPKGIIR
jgi:hypothetical protein